MSANWKLSFLILGLCVIAVWLAVLSYPASKFRLIACDVGQGDAILATYKKYQVLVDGGPSNKVLECLSDYMPFWDREIEVVVMTHPQTDHFQGLIDVFKNYRVNTFLADGLDSSSTEFGVLKNQVGGGETKVVNPTNGTMIRVSLIYLDVLWPTEEYITQNSSQIADLGGESILGTYTSKRDPNDFSIVANLSFGDFDALLTGDIGPEVIDQIIATGDIKDVDYIKIPHHGSKNGLTQKLLDAASPEIAVISVGKNNTYGHPRKEILDTLKSAGVKIFRTGETGDVVVESDGTDWGISGSWD